MIEKFKLEVLLLLPDNGECDGCVQRLQKALRRHRGIDEAHVDQDGGSVRLCLHYDPNLISLAEVERQARQEGITIQQRFRHRQLQIEGMDCADCAAKLEKGVGRLEGVLYCAVNFTAAKMAVEYDVETLDQGAIVKRIRRLGYDVAGEDAGVGLTQGTGPGGLRGLLTFMWGKRRDTLTLLAGLLILLAFALETSGVSIIFTHTLYTVAIATGGFYVARKGLTGAWINRELDINFLMTIAAVGAAAIGAWEEGALVVFLFSLGETLESYTMDRARNAIRSLMELAPAEAILLSRGAGERGSGGEQETRKGGEGERVPVAELAVGDSILVRPGERVPMDGRVIRGASAVNQAPITGESIPAEKGPGDDVFAGSVNGEGALEIEVTRLAADNTISRIIHMVEEAQAQKAPSQRWVDGFARYYTPVVVGLAIFIAAVPPLFLNQPFLEPATGSHGWLYRALALLIIACPCALVISTPVSIVSAISNAARNGVLVKGGAHLEAAGGLRVVAFDKTGTLTRGEPAVTDILDRRRTMDDGRWTSEFLRLAASAESVSEHPLGQAIVEHALERGIELAEVTEFRAMPGKGVRAFVDGRTVFVGSPAFFTQDLGADLSPVQADLERLQGEGKTVVLVGQAPGDPSSAVRGPSSLVGLIAVADTVRPDAREAVAALKRSGIRHTVMLTGDNDRTAAAIAAQVGMDEVRANLLPGEKVDAMERLLAEYGQVAMVGDGVNDAPALARATVGIAMGGAGTDQALETADIALMADDLSKLPFAIQLSRRALGVIRQNVAFSLLVKAAFMALAIPGLATLWMAVFADMGASLIVILNGMRLLRSRS